MKDELEKGMLLKSMLWVRDQMASRDWKQESNLYLMNPNQECYALYCTGDIGFSYLLLIL